MMMIRRSAAAVLISAAFGLAAAPMAWADPQGADDTVLDVVDNVIIETWGPPATPAPLMPLVPPPPINCPNCGS